MSTHSLSQLLAKMKPLLLMIVAISICGYANAGPRHYQECSICINGDPEDPWPRETRKECRTWLRSHDRKAFRQIINRSEVDQVLSRSAIECDEVNIYGSFHSSEEYIHLPFDISLAVSRAYKPTVLTYTGSSCLIFHNVDQLAAYAEPLTKQRSTRFQISGNQNEGMVSRFWPILGWHEIKRQSSKVTVVIEQGNSRLDYEKCSIPNQGCVLDDFQEITTKYCANEGHVVTQSCCWGDAFKLRLSRNDGLWSLPGKTCKESSL